VSAAPDLRGEPPHNAEAEAALVGAALVYGTAALDNTLELRPTAFFLPAHRNAWEGILAARARAASVVDIVTVEDEIRAAGLGGHFEGGWQAWAVAAGQKACVPELVEHYAAIVREHAATRKLINICTELMARAYGGARLAELLDLNRTEVTALELAGTTSRTVHLSAAGKELITELDRTDQSQVPQVVPSGIGPLDRIIYGFEGGQLNIVAARPGKGKTALACTIGFAASLLGIPVLYFSLEMQTRAIARRLVISDSKMPIRHLRGLIDKDVWRKVMRSVEKFSTANMWLNDTRQLSQIIAEIRRWHAREVAKRKLLNGLPDRRCLVVVDYAQLVKVPRQRGVSREQEVAEISASLKEVAMALDLPVILLAQLNRDVEKEKRAPELKDLRESGSLEQDASIVLFPHQQGDQQQIIVAKNRDGETGYAEVEFEKETVSFGPLEPPQLELGQQPRNWQDTDDR
jgi:replicative DNA helicase